MKRDLEACRITIYWVPKKGFSPIYGSVVGCSHAGGDYSYFKIIYIYTPIIVSLIGKYEDNTNGD